MLNKKADITFQRHYDSLHFHYTHHCNSAIDILENNCIHIKSKNTIIYITEDELEKLEAIRPLLLSNNLEQIKNITKMFSRPTIQRIESILNKKIGWFFKNGNKA